MKVILAENGADMSVRAASIIAEEIRRRPDALLALSTGASPVGCYEELVRMHREEGLDFSRVRAMNMDEYAGLGREHPQGYYYFMKQHLYRRVNICPDRTFGPDALHENLKEAGRAFDARIEREGGIDLILLGIGRDGHIAFNMPGAELVLETHPQKLSEATVRDNARFFDRIEEVPGQALTIGIKHIFGSRKVVLIASGAAKSDIMAKFLNSKTVNPQIPATVLKLHPDVTVIADREAAQKLGGIVCG